MRKTAYDNYGISYFKDYTGGFIYKTVVDSVGSSNTELEFLTTSEGKAKQREDGTLINAPLNKVINTTPDETNNNGK